MFQAVNAVTNLIRTLLAVAVAAVVGTAGYFGYQSMHSRDAELEAKEKQLQQSQVKIDELSREVAVQQQEIERLLTAVRLLKVDHRVAQITVLDQSPTADGKNITTTFRFVEVDDEGKPIGPPQPFTIIGDVVYVDGWVAKFQDELVETGDPLRSTSIFLFRRIFGEFQEPKDGSPIDAVGSRPAAYSHDRPASELERDIWSQFWEYANDPKKAEQAGLRAVHGEAASMKLKKDKRYRVLLRASDGVSIVPEDGPPAVRGDSL